MVSEPAALTISPVGREALDDPVSDPALVARMLEEIATANRWFGGRRAAWQGLRTLLDTGDRGNGLTLLDIGTGAGDLPRWLARRCAAHGVALRLFGVERLRAAADLARRAGIAVAMADGGTLPWRDASVDLVLLSQVAHHFDDASVVRLLREAARVARRGVIVADLRPSRAAGAAYRVAGTALRFHRMTVDDGVTSLARGFTVARLGALLAGAGVSRPAIATLPFARIVATWRVAH